MDDDQTPPTDPIPEAPAPEPVIEVPPEPVESTDPLPTDTPPLAPESPISIPTPIPVEDQNEGSNQPESITPEPQNQVPDQSGFIHGLLVLPGRPRSNQTGKRSWTSSWPWRKRKGSNRIRRNAP